MTLREARVLYTKCMSQFILDIINDESLHIKYGKIEIAYGEGYVIKIRKAKNIGTDTYLFVADAMHLVNGTHYHGTGSDLIIYINGEYLTDGDHPLYEEMGKRWENYSSLARWGGRFGNKNKDSNHFSFEWDGKK